MDQQPPPSPWARPAPPAPPPEVMAAAEDRRHWLLSIILGMLTGAGAVLLIGAIITMAT